MSAAALIAEIGDDMSKFEGVTGIASWTGLCPGKNDSAKKRKSSSGIFTAKVHIPTQSQKYYCQHQAITNTAHFIFMVTSIGNLFTRQALEQC